MKTILCYGDSLTYGANPIPGGPRHAYEDRWPTRLEAGLGAVVVAARAELARIDRERDEAVAAIRAEAEQEAARVREAAREEAATVRGAAASLSSPG